MPLPVDKKPVRANNGASDFRPAWWCRNPHLQTVWRRALGARPSLAYRRERIDTPDGDFLDLDWTDAGNLDPSAPIVFVLHGLEGCSLSKYVVGLLAAVSPLGCRGVAMNFRSCSGELNRLPRFYHSGETTDLAFVTSIISARHPLAPIVIIGFSLGGNVLLKWLGENGERIPDSVAAAAAVSVPYDLEIAARHIDLGMNRSVYAAAFLRTLKEKMLEKIRRFPGLFDPPSIRAIRSFAEFDERVTAPLHGFQDARDYWRRSSSAGYLAAIRRPTLLLSAHDDPFLPGEYLPHAIAASSRWLTPEFHRHGGHVGFVAGAVPFRSRYWTDIRLARFVLDQTSPR